MRRWVLAGAVAALAVVTSGCGGAGPVGNRALPSSSPHGTSGKSSTPPPISPTALPSSNSVAVPLTSPLATPTPEPLPDCPAPDSVPKDTTPPSLRVTLELAKTTFHQGEEITGELVLENVSDERVYYWEGFWPLGLVQEGRWVGGRDNLGLTTQGWERYWLDPGEVRRYPSDNQGFGWWHGAIDTLGCRQSHYEERPLLPPGTYTAFVSFPVGERFEKPVGDEGAQDRIEISIVP